MSNTLMSADSENREVKSDFWLLVQEKPVTNEKKTYTLDNGRKFSDYYGYITVAIIPEESGYIRPCGVLPLSTFIDIRNVEFTFYSNGSVQWVDLIYNSDTSVSVQASVNGNVTVFALVSESYEKE